MSETTYGYDCRRLRVVRQEKGLTVAEIAAVAGLSTRAVNFYLAGSRHPRPEKLLRLAQAVGIDDPLELCDVGESERIIHLRIRVGKNRARVAKELGWHPETYREWETTGRAEGKMRGPRDTWEPDPDRPGWGWLRPTPFFTRPITEAGASVDGQWRPAVFGPYEYGKPEHFAVFEVPADRLAQARRRTHDTWRTGWQREDPELAAQLDQVAAEFRRS
jgi:DNA-binding XRE family transcriptional regulator